MAITWPLKITPISIEEKTASIVATRIDSEDLDNPKIYNVAQALLDTPANQLAALDEIWAKHQAQLDSDAAVDNFVAALESSGKSNLEGRET